MYRSKNRKIFAPFYVYFLHVIQSFILSVIHVAITEKFDYNYMVSFWIKNNQ